MFAPLNNFTVNLFLHIFKNGLEHMKKYKRKEIEKHFQLAGQFLDKIHSKNKARIARIQGNLPTNMRYLCGCRASSMIGIMLVRFFATLRRSRPDL